jgi:hypothetical protein
MITLDTSLLTAALAPRTAATDRAAATASSTAALKSASERRADAQRKALENAAPWAGLADLGVKENERRSSELARSLIAGAPAISEAARRTGGPSREDARQLFAAFQGLASLRALAQRVETGNLSADERARVVARFNAGMGEVGGFIADMDPKNIVVAASARPDQLESRFALQRNVSQIVTGPLTTGSASEVVTGMDGDVRFDIVVNAGGPGEKRASIDLAELGAQPRTLNAIINLANTKLTEAGIATRLAASALGPAPSAPGSTTPGPARFGIRVNGFATEALRFEPHPATTSAGLITVKATASGATIQKLSDLGGAAAEGGPARDVAAANGALQVRAAAQGTDGSVFLVGEIEGQAAGSLGAKGERDAVLIKLDATGRQVWSRLLGASQAGQGFSVAVGAGGTVAVAGSVRGRVDGLPAGSNGTDAFVAAFDGDGEKLFVRQLGEGSVDEARAVAVGADGAVFVGGRTNGAVNGVAGAGGADGFIAAYEADGSQRFLRAFGGAGDDAIGALAVTADGGLVAGGNESGAGVVRRLDATGADVWQIATAALGAGGGIRSVAVEGSRIAVAGVSEFASDLGFGAPITAAPGGVADGFVMALTDGPSGTVDWTSFVGSTEADAVSGVSVAGGSIYLAGETTAQGSSAGARAFVAKLDAGGGEVWRRTDAGSAGPGRGVAALGAVDGYSALDRLGLPTGDVEFESAVSLTERTALRAGDHFFVRVNGGAARRIEIADGDTMTVLSRRVNAVLRAAGAAAASITTAGERLRINADEGQRIELEAGASGRDALKILGLREGVVARAYADNDVAIRKEAPKVFGLGFDDGWAIDDPTKAADARRKIEAAQFNTRLAFEGLFTPIQPKKKNSVQSLPPAWLQTQLKNYAAGLARLEQGQASFGLGGSTF